MDFKSKLTAAEKKSRVRKSLTARKKKAEDDEKEEKLRILIDREVKKRDSEPPHFPSSFKSRNSRRRSGSVQRPLRSTRSKRTKSLDKIENLLADDMTRHTRAIAKIKQKKGTIFDHLQTMPRSIQSEIYSMGVDRHPISSSEVKIASHNILLLPISNDKRFDWPYESAWDVFENGAMYHTFMFDGGDDNFPSIYHNNVIFAKNYNEFVEKTKIEYTLKDGCILYRVVPKYINLHTLNRNQYDGFIVIDMEDDVLDMNIHSEMPWDYVGPGPPDRNPKFTDRIQTIMRTYFSNIANRYCILYKMTWNDTALTCIRLDTPKPVPTPKPSKRARMLSMLFGL
jgi:hypothetical protein